MQFASDNVAPVHPKVMEALAQANKGAASSYGEDDLTHRLEARVAELFEHEVAVFPVFTGTAANALALSVLTPPWGAVLCHSLSHINTDECGAPEFFSHGAKLVGIGGEGAKIEPSRLAAAMEGLPKGVVHHVQASALSITQATELGTVYTKDEVSELAGIARQSGLSVHMDGARLANALCALGCAPADITWKAGIDFLSFGFTKNGALAGEAIVAFGKEHAEELAYRRKRGGQLASKMRYLSAQCLALLEENLWLDLATHANRMASYIAAGLATVPGVELVAPCQANEVFARMPIGLVDHLRETGAFFHAWPMTQDPPGSRTVRFVTSFETEISEVRSLLEAAQAHVAGPNG